MRVVRFRPDIAGDLRGAIDWYNGKRTGLGGEFVAEYWSAIERITNQPLA